MLAFAIYDASGPMVAVVEWQCDVSHGGWQKAAAVSDKHRSVLPGSDIGGDDAGGGVANRVDGVVVTTLVVAMATLVQVLDW